MATELPIEPPSKPPSAAKKHHSSWSIAKSNALYGVQDWGMGYFDISPQGNLVVQLPAEDSSVQIPIIDIIEGMKERGMDMPSILRIENLLDERIKTLNESFTHAIKDNGYQNEYRGVFPIKVNQQCHVIEENWCRD